MSDIEARIYSASEAQIADFSMLVYGPAGSGKTHLARTAADAGLSVLLIDAEPGAMTVRGSSVDVLPVRSAADVSEAYKLVAGCLGRWDVVVLDSLTDIQEFFIRASQGDKDRPSMQDWGDIITRTARFVGAWKSLPLSLVVTALSAEIEDDGRVLCRPHVAGRKLPHRLPGMFDLVAYSGKKDDGGELRYTLTFAAPGDRLCVKDRSGKMAAVEDSNLGAIVNKVLGNKGGDDE